VGNAGLLQAAVNPEPDRFAQMETWAINHRYNHNLWRLL